MDCRETGERIEAEVTPLVLPEATTWANNMNMTTTGAASGSRSTRPGSCAADAGAATWTLHLAVEHYEG